MANKGGQRRDLTIHHHFRCRELRNHRQGSRKAGRQARLVSEPPKEANTTLSSRKGEEATENKPRAEPGLLDLAAFRHM